MFRSQTLGSSVTITGLVTNGDELGPIRYVEDGTMGIKLFTIYQLITYSMEFQRGDSITITGTLVDYNEATGNESYIISYYSQSTIQLLKL